MSENKRTGALAFLVKNADSILAFAKVALPSSFTGALVGWATWFVGLFQQYSPASWIFAAVIGSAVGALISLMYSLTKEKLQVIRFRNSVFDANRINPLDMHYRSQRIRIADLSPPIGAIIAHRTFIDCDIIGPANAVFFNCTFTRNRGDGVDGLLIKQGYEPKNGFGFNACTFQDCRFFLVTFLVPEQDYSSFHRWTGINWITETPDTQSVPRVSSIEEIEIPNGQQTGQ